MDCRTIADEVTRLLASESPGTRLIVWSDSTLTRSSVAANPVLVPGAPSQPLVFFVAGFDRPVHDAILLRIRRALGPGQAA